MCLLPLHTAECACQRACGDLCVKLHAEEGKEASVEENERRANFKAQLGCWRMEMDILESGKTHRNTSDEPCVSFQTTLVSESAKKSVMLACLPHSDQMFPRERETG